MNGLNLSKMEELKLILQQHSFDILGITETKLSSSHADGLFQILGYNRVRRDRVSRAGGGSIVYVKNSLEYSIVEFDCMEVTELEFTAVKVKCGKQRPFIYLNVYRPPKLAYEIFEASFRTAVKNLLKTGLEIFIAGDFNINLHVNTKESKLLKSLSKTLSLSQLIKEPTRVTARSSSLLDHFYVTNACNIIESGVIRVGFSDHEAIFAVRKLQRQRFSPRVINVRDFKETDWKKVQDDIASFNWEPISQFSNTTFSLEYFRICLEIIIDRHSNLTKKRVNGKPAPWLSPQVISLMKKRDKLRNSIHCLQSHERVAAEHEYKKLRNHISNLIRYSKTKYFKQMFVNCGNPQEFWRSYFVLTGKTKSNSIISELQMNGISIDNKDDISCALHDTFSYNSNSDNNLEDYRKQPEYEPQAFTAEELHAALVKLKKKRSDACAAICYEVIQSCAKSLTPVLASLFTAFLTHGSIPSILKTARVLPLYKGKGVKTNPRSYRPISTLPVLHKIFEYLLHARIMTQVDDKLSDSQHGFRNNRSCFTAMLQFSTEAYGALDKVKGRMGVVAVDLRQAFDSCRHDTLLWKLREKFKLQPDLLNILVSYFTDRTYCIVNGQHVSKPFPVTYGVPQGSILGPLLFICYVNDSSVAIPPTVSHLYYADDLLLYYGGNNNSLIAKELELAVSSLHDWYSDNGLEINYEKTEAMLFFKDGDPEAKEEVFQLNVHGHVIRTTDLLRYLGIWLDNKLDFNGHFDKVVSKISPIIGAFRRLKRFLSFDQLSQLLKTTVLSTLDYALPIWAVHDSSRLQNIQNKINRTLLDFRLRDTFCLRNKGRKKVIYESDMLERANILSVNERVEYYSSLFIFKCLRHPPNIGFLTELFVRRPAGRTRASQQSETDLQVTHRHRTTTFTRSFIYRSVKLWNNLPNSLRDLQFSVGKFKSEIASHIISKRLTLAEENRIYYVV